MTVLCGFGLSGIQIDSSYTSWFLEDDPVLQTTEDFIETFGNDDFVAILVKADDVFAPDILRMIRRLSTQLLEEVPYADEVVSLTNFEFTSGTDGSIEILNIVPEKIPDDPAAIEAIRTLAFSKPFRVNRLFAEDSTEAWILLRLQPYPATIAPEAPLPAAQVAQAVTALLARDEYQDYTLLSAGNPIRHYAQRRFVTSESARMIGLAFLAILIVLFIIVRSVRNVVAVALVCVGAFVIDFGIMGWLNMTLDPLVFTLPIYLTLALSVGYAIHLFNFFNQHFRKSGKRQEAVILAVEQAGWPMLFTSLTTIGAMVAFYSVPVQLIRWEGFACITAIATVYLLVMLLLPAILSVGNDRVPQDRPASHSTTFRLPERFFSHFSQWIITHPLHILLAFGVLVIACISGMTRMEVNMDDARTLGLKVPYVARFSEVSRSQVGTSLSYNVTLRFAVPNQAKRSEILNNLEVLAEDINSFPLVKRTSSLVDVVKDLNQAVHANAAAHYRIPGKPEEIAQLFSLYDMAAGAEIEQWVDSNFRTLRLKVELTNFNTSEVEREMHQIEQWAAKLFPQADVSMAGSVVNIAVAQNYVARGEIRSFLIAMVMIGVLMMLVFRSVKTGLIAMIPNVAPALVVGGVMGFAGIPLDMMTMVVIPMLLGLAVDDTIHFITHSRQTFEQNRTYALAIHDTFQRVGSALSMTSGILILAFATYLTSRANVFFNLGLLVMIGVFSALAADYCVTPVLLHLTRPFGEELQHRN